MLEIDILRELYSKGEQLLDVSIVLNIQIDQFYGIEYDEFAARIAEVAMWLIDHQMNMKISEEFGQYFVRLPLTKSANIIHGNSLQIAWESMVPKNELSYIIGNPPFYGSRNQTKEQKQDMKLVFSGVKRAGVLDYVAAWYLLAAKYIKNTEIKVGFVSTNSILQGEQTGILWNELLNNYGIKIHFAHTTFNWTNEARGKAAVHCVIIGFANFEIKDKFLYEYDDINLEPQLRAVKNINPYLVEANTILILSRSKPVCNVQPMMKGNAAIDDGNFVLEPNEKEEFLKLYPEAEHLVRPYIGSKEIINGLERYCLWLKDASPKILKQNPEVSKRIENIKDWRSNSKKAATRKYANFPTLFMEGR